MNKKYKCRVEYLESTGTQYIDTGVIGNSEFNIKYGLYANSIGSSSDIFAGARSSTQHLNFGQAASNGQFTLGYLNQYWQELSNFAINTRYDIEISYKSGEQYAIINGTKGSSKTYTGTEQTDLTIYLFKRHHYGTDNVGGLQGRIYYFTIKQNDVLVRDFIPVLDNSGRPAMYDQVSGQLFYNQGTGEFTYGRQIIPVEYLESTGTQYIDTGIKGKNNLQYKTKINYTNLSTSASNGIGGEYLGNASAYIGMVRANGHFTYLFNNTAVETTKTFYANTDYVIDSTMNNGSQIVKVNNETISTGTLSGTFTSTRNIFLYAVCSTNDAADVYGSLKMYYCQIYDNDVLVRDFIPCIDENLTPFMFDKVQNTVYLNDGTGQFKVGPNVEKSWSGKKLRRKLALALANLKKKRKYYCEVEYLESTGTQYINTGLLSTANSKVDCVFGFSSMESGAAHNVGVFGGRNATTTNTFTFFKIASGNPQYFRFDYNGQVTVATANQMTWNTSSKYRFQYNGTNYTTTNTTTGESVSGAISPATTFTQYPIHLFAVNTAGAVGINLSGRIYRYWYTDGTNTIDLIPVLDWNYVPCMYDRVTEQLFYNAGSGNFTAGREIHQVDYIQTIYSEDSKSFIDTGYYPNLNTKVEFMASGINADSFAASTSGTWFTGGRQAYQQKMFGSHYNPSNQNLYFSFSTTQNSSYYSSSSMYGDNKKFTLDKTGLYINDTKAVNNTNTTNFTSPATLTIFALNNNGTVLSFTGYKLQYYKIWDNNTLVRDYIPAIDENGVGYMLDRVSHTIYDNAGTGAFGYSGREVEYLESDGARAIIAGVTVDDTCGYDVKWMALNANDTIIMGTKGSGDSRWVLSGSNNPNVNISWNTSSGGVGLGLNKIQTAQMNYFNDRKRILNDTPLTDITTTLSSAASTYNVGIFGGYWGASSISLYSTCRIYYAKISKGTVLIRDFVPMVKDGSPCLFDKIGGLYYFGTGTGSFSNGKIVEPEYE